MSGRGAAGSRGSGWLLALEEMATLGGRTTNKGTGTVRRTFSSQVCVRSTSDATSGAEVRV